MGDKRKYMRFNVLMDAIARTGGMLKKLKINNFSKEGIGVLSQDSLKKGEEIEVELTIPGDNIPVLLQGEIAWASDPLADNSKFSGGVKFKKIENNDRGRILEYIYQRWLTSAEAGLKR